MHSSVKYFLGLLALFFYPDTFAQQKPKIKEVFYDRDWKVCEPENAVYYSTLQKTDSGWLRNDYFTGSKTLQMQALYKDEACKIKNGHYAYFYSNGKPSSLGKTILGKKEGVCIGYYFNGMMADSAFWRNDEVVDKRFRWHRNGYMADSISRINDSLEAQVGWFDDGSIAYAGYLLNGKENGKWKFYHHNGQLASVELYDNGKSLKKEYFKEDGSQQTDTSNVNREASFKGGPAGWQKYLNKALYWPHNLRLSISGSVVVEVAFVINEQGKPEGVEVLVPFHPDFDHIAESAILRSPLWVPAISHNRKVKFYQRQSVTFVQPD